MSLPLLGALGGRLRSAVTAFLGALQFLTVVPPLVRRPFTGAELGQAVGYFPLVGVLLGGTLAGLDRLLALVFPPGVTTALVLACWVLATGALHLDGFLDTCDGLLGGRTPEDRLRILRDEHVGAFAVVGGVLLVLVKYQALASVPDRSTALVLALTLGRWGMTLALVAFPYGRGQGLGRDMKDHAGRRQLALASATALAVAGLTGGWRGLVALLLGGLLTWVLARFALARLPGLTGDLYGALCELLEVLVLLTLIAGDRGPIMSPEPRPEVRDLPAAVHGGPDLAELRRLGLGPADVLDFSVNTNPYGPSPAVREAVARAPLDRYPDRETLGLRAALAESLGDSPRRILAGNGSSELIWLTALAFVRPGDRVLVLGPTFCEYARAAALLGAEVISHQARAQQGFALNGDEVHHTVARLAPRLVFLANPNNPTGTTVAPETIAAWARKHSRTLFVVDEAYLAFAPGLGSVLAGAGDNVLVLRSQTKDFALAGLRLGYAVGAEELITMLARVRPPWTVSAPAQAAGVAALKDRDHLTQSLGRLAAAKDELVTALAGLGLIPLPSAVHFFLLRVGDGAAFRLALLRRGILVRDCASFGLPEYVRVSTRRPDENARLLEAIQEVQTR